LHWALGHAHLSTTQIYANPTAEDVIESNPGSQNARRLGLIRTLDWLEAQPGQTW